MLPAVLLQDSDQKPNICQYFKSQPTHTLRTILFGDN